ncbi:MAG: hypothetical protein NTX81_01035 [Candidatus Bathyarchaeota archaeon]|nr:hypothetical protein [Candidatus Bathyarchaeota archaeon]
MSDDIHVLSVNYDRKTSQYLCTKCQLPFADINDLRKHDRQAHVPGENLDQLVKDMIKEHGHK